MSISIQTTFRIKKRGFIYCLAINGIVKGDLHLRLCVFVTGVPRIAYKVAWASQLPSAFPITPTG